MRSATLVLIAWSCVVGCTTNDSTPTFSGEPEAIALAEKMFSSIGGMDAWCDLRSLYVKAEHREPQMTIPYTSEIWRAIDTFKLVIEQQNDSFHVKARFSPNEGSIRYLDERDTSRILTTDQLKNWEYNHRHNIYVLLHDLACEPQSYEVRFDEKDRLAFYRDSVFETSFELDDKMRPYMFYSPNIDGSVTGSIFTRWSEDQGLLHSAGGHPLDSSFIYRTEIWTPSKLSLEAAFGKDIPDLD